MAQISYRSDEQDSTGDLLRLDRILRHLSAHWELAKAFAVRDFKALHKSSYLGFAWVVISPLIMLGLFTAVFGGVFRGRFSSNADETALDFALGLFLGLTLFQMMAGTLGAAASLIRSNAAYLKSARFPAEVLPLANVLTNLLVSIINVAVCLGLSLVVHGYLYWEVLWMPVFIVLMFIYCLGVCYVLSAISAFIQDLASIVPPLSLILMFWSLVFFPISAIPESVRWTVQINPLAMIIEQARGALMYGHEPNVLSLVLVAIVGVVFFTISYYIFMRARRAFADVL